jgi:hypothetical protein
MVTVAESIYLGRWKMEILHVVKVIAKNNGPHPCCPLCWVCCLAHPNGLDLHLTQHNGQGLDHSIVQKHPPIRDPRV